MTKKKFNGPSGIKKILCPGYFSIFEFSKHHLPLIFVIFNM